MAQIKNIHSIDDESEKRNNTRQIVSAQLIVVVIIRIQCHLFRYFQ